MGYGIKQFQKGGLSGQNIMNLMATLEANTEMNRLKSIEDAWRSYQEERRTQAEKDLITRGRYGAIGGKGGGFFGQAASKRYGIENPLLKAGTTALGSGLGSWLGTALAPDVAKLSWADFAKDRELGDSRFHKGSRSRLKSGALSDEDLFSSNIDKSKRSQDLENILGAFSDMAFFGELEGDDWLQDILDMFSPKPGEPNDPMFT